MLDTQSVVGDVGASDEATYVNVTCQIDSDSVASLVEYLFLNKFKPFHLI